MPSTDPDPPRFTTVDWESHGATWRPDARTLGLVVALAVVAGLFAYDYLESPRRLLVLFEWHPSRIDWLFALSVVVLARYVAVPIVVDRDRIGGALWAFVSRPAGALVVAYLAAFTVLGLVGPNTLYPVEWAKLEFHHQPPVFTSVNPETPFYDCAGRTVGEHCHGSWRYPLGTTRSGEDVLHLVLEGVQTSFQIGLSTAVLMAIVATAVGTVAGYYGGLVDDVLMGYVNVQQTIPAIVVYIVLATMYFGHIEGVSDGSAFVFILVFGLLDWGGIARVVRSEVQVRRASGYVRAARVAGASNLQVLRRHVVPNTRASIVEALTRRIPLIILAQIALAYLHLNRIDSESFGRLFRIGLEDNHLPWHQKWWVTTFATLALVLTVLAFNLLGDLARDALDPQEAE